MSTMSRERMEQRVLGYVLDGHTPRQTKDWAEFEAFSVDFERRRVAHTDLADDVRVSTVFLRWDHNFYDDGPPILFETMVFGGPFDQQHQRYETWDEAQAGHQRVVTALQEGRDPWE